MTEGLTCRTCKWWKALPNGKEGECRRHSPSPLTSTKFPRTIYSDFCGEHSAIDDHHGEERNELLGRIAESLRKIEEKIVETWEEAHVVVNAEDESDG